MLKGVFLLMMLTGVLNTLWSQRLYYCDSVVVSNKTLITGECNYFYNFLSETLDSVITHKINFDKDNEIIYKKIKIVAPIGPSGMINGLIKAFVDSEKILEVPYNNNVPNGFYVQFKDNDTLGHVNIINGKKEGVQIRYLDQEHTMLVISPYENGVLNGKLVLKEFGNITTITNYKNGLRNGLHSVFYNTGELEVFRIYEDDKVKDGKYYTFTIDGEISVESTYINNKEVKIILYGVDGSVRKIIEND